MANTAVEWDDDDDYGDEDLPKKLRKQIKELSKERDSLVSELDGFRQSERKRVLGSALQDKGLNPKIAAFVPSDIDTENIDTWLDEYGDVFGGVAPEMPQQDEVTPQQPVIAQNAAEAQAIRQMAAAEQGGQPTDNGDILASINDAQSIDELMNALRR